MVSGLHLQNVNTDCIMSGADDTAPIDEDPVPTEGIRTGITTLAAAGIVVIGLLVFEWQTYFTVVVTPARVDRTCVAGSRESIPITEANRTHQMVRVVGVTSDCGCFRTSERFPLSIPARGRREITVEYSCPDAGGTNRIGVMVADDSTRLFEVVVRHTVRSGGG